MPAPAIGSFRERRATLRIHARHARIAHLRADALVAPREDDTRFSYRGQCDVPTLSPLQTQALWLVLRPRYPDQAVPHFRTERLGIIECRGTPHVQSLDNGLGPDIVGRSIGEHLLQLDPLKNIPQCRLGRLRSVALPPGRMDKTP